MALSGALEGEVTLFVAPAPYASPRTAIAPKAWASLGEHSNGPNRSRRTLGLCQKPALCLHRTGLYLCHLEKAYWETWSGATPEVSWPCGVRFGGWGGASLSPSRRTSRRSTGHCKTPTTAPRSSE